MGENFEPFAEISEPQDRLLPSDECSELHDELGPLIAEFRREHPWHWRRAVVRDWLDRQVGRWVPRLCRHRTAEGPIEGPLTCMDCDKEIQDA